MDEDAGIASAHADTVLAAARAGEPDRYLAALLAPPPAREALLALAAFSAELGRVPYAAPGEPTMGEIRLQWWREALEPAHGAARTGSPVADALNAAVARHALSRALLLDMIEARSFDLAGEVMTDEAALRLYLWRTEGVPFALAARMLARETAIDLEAAAAACGHAYGLARLLGDLARTLSRGRVLLPRTLLDAAGVSPQALLAGESGDGVAGLLAGLRSRAREALVTSRQHVAKLPRRLRSAFLPLALVEPYLRAQERPGRDPLRGSAEILPLVRVYRIWMAHWLGRV